MHCEKLLCAGFGGQGVMSLGKILAYGGMLEGKKVTWLPSYGPEMRGGTAYCCVMISDKPIGSPLITDDATSGIIMNLPSFAKFEPRISDGGLMLVNSSLVNKTSRRTDLHAYYIPAVEEAEICGDARMANTVMLGAYLQVTNLITEASILKAFRLVFGTTSKKVLHQNKEALARGRDIIHNQMSTSAAI